MKKLLLSFFVLILPLLLVACGKNSADDNKDATPAGPVYSVQIEIECVENLIFSKYDIDVFVDKNKLETLDHGTTQTYSLELEEGTHTLVVAKEGNKSVDGTVEFAVSENSNFCYKIACTSQQVKIEKVNEDNGESEVDATANSVEDTSRTLSGFNISTNQTITFCGIIFSFPDYFDELESETISSDYAHYYPKEKDYYCSLIFSASDTEFSQSEFDNNKSEIANEYIKEQGSIENINSASATIAGLSGWSISYVTTDPENPTTVNLHFAFNPVYQKIVVILLAFDSHDLSNYDYIGDYNKVLQSATLEETSNPNNSIYDAAYIRKFPEYSLYFLIDTDDKIVKWFSTNDVSAWSGTYTGDLNSGIKIYYDFDGGIEETLRYKSAGDDSIVIETDPNGFDWEYNKVDIAEAEAALDRLGNMDMNPSDEQAGRTDNQPAEDKKKELPLHQAKRAFEYYGSYLYPYGFDCHWFTKLYEDTQFEDGSWQLKVGVTITNQYGASFEATAEALINNTTQSVENFDVYIE